MKASAFILIKSFVTPFYRENAGTLFFFMTAMIFCVGPLNGAGLIEYHYSLMMAISGSDQFFLIVCVLWLLYARKCGAFVIRTAFNPQFNFLRLINCVSMTRRLALLTAVQMILLAPILLYASILTVVAGYHHYTGITTILVVYLIVLCTCPAAWYALQLANTEKPVFMRLKPLHFLSALAKPLYTFYPFILLRFISFEQKWILLGLKLFTCGILGGMLFNNTVLDYELGFPFLFFNFGIVASGIFIYRTRIFEETHLFFCRGLPVSLLRRWLEYALVYALVLVPELLTLIFLTPVHLHTADAWNFGLCAYSVLLLLNGMSFMDDFSMNTYLRVLLAVIGVEYFFVIADALNILYVVLFALGTPIFFLSYYSFEKKKGQIGN